MLFQDKSLQDVDVPISTQETDPISKEAFDYINEYRVANELPEFVFDYNVYLVALNMSNQKQESPLMFRQAPERSDFVESAIDLSNFPVQYIFIYSMEGAGITEFRNQFDFIYFVKNTIKTDKYDTGAIGCNIDYCSLIILNDEGAIEFTQEF